MMADTDKLVAAAREQAGGLEHWADVLEAHEPESSTAGIVMLRAAARSLRELAERGVVVDERLKYLERDRRILQAVAEAVEHEDDPWDEIPGFVRQLWNDSQRQEQVVTAQWVKRLAYALIYGKDQIEGKEAVELGREAIDWLGKRPVPIEPSEAAIEALKAIRLAKMNVDLVVEATICGYAERRPVLKSELVGDEVEEILEAAAEAQRLLSAWLAAYRAQFTQETGEK